MSSSNGIEVEEEDLDDLELMNTPIEELQTEEVVLIFLGIDASGSMQIYERVMQEELEKFKRSIEQSKENERILVARADFSDFLIIRGYKKVDDVDTDYKTYNSTRLYDTIVDGSKGLFEYMEYLRSQGMRVRAVFSIFSDGQENDSKASRAQTKRVVEDLKKAEIVTAFIAFGEDALDEAMRLNFQNMLEVGRSESELRMAFNQLSRSSISHSKSSSTSTDDFFQI